MIARYNRLSLMVGLPGLAAQWIGLLLPPDAVAPWAGQALLVLGTILLFIGLGYYASAKGQSPLWCLLGVFSILGFIALGMLKDLAPDGVPRKPDEGRPAPPPSARRAAAGSAPPAAAPGHAFNENGVCVHCGAGSSAAHKPCVK